MALPVGAGAEPARDVRCGRRWRDSLTAEYGRSHVAARAGRSAGEIPWPGASSCATDGRARAALISADTDNGPVAASIIKLWLLGSWYALGQQNVSVVVSSNSYTNGWIWPILQAHPMGYSMMEFGYWADQPPPLSEFLTPPSQS